MSIFTTAVAAAAATLALAWGAGQFASQSLHTEIEIAAPPAAVWAALAGTGSYADWNPFVTRLDGTLAEGERLTVTIRPPGKPAMTFRPRVLAAEADRELRWVGQLGLPGVFDGAHHFVLEATPGGTRLTHGETFRGMLVPVLFPMLADSTEAGFRAMNAALKARVEAQG